MNVDDSVPKQSEFFYSSDRKKLSEELPIKFETTGASSNPKTVFITGGTGFLGSYILQELVLQGKSVRALRRNLTVPFYIHPGLLDKISWVQGDILDVNGSSHR